MARRDAKQVRAELRHAQRALREWRARENEYIPGGRYIRTLRRLEHDVNRLTKERAAEDG